MMIFKRAASTRYNLTVGQVILFETVDRLHDKLKSHRIFLPVTKMGRPTFAATSMVPATVVPPFNLCEWQ